MWILLYFYSIFRFQIQCHEYIAHVGYNWWWFTTIQKESTLFDTAKTKEATFIVDIHPKRHYLNVIRNICIPRETQFNSEVVLNSMNGYHINRINNSSRNNSNNSKKKNQHHHTFQIYFLSMCRWRFCM